jgi:sugar lactone lactonase YvrE
MIGNFRGQKNMRHTRIVNCVLAIALLIPGGLAISAADDPNSAPQLYRVDEGWAKLPPGRKWGAAVGVDIDRDGKSIWVFDRCATADDCSESNLDPIQKFDATGKLVTSFGSGMFNYPHGLFIDRDDNIWVSDGRAKNGKGHTVMKFSPTGKLLTTLGKPGVAGDGPDTFNAPSDIYVTANGTICVADGHGGNTNARIVKFDKNGKFIKAWGKKGTGQGEFDQPHGLAMDSAGRLYVAVARTAASRFSIRMENSSPNGASSAAPAASSSIRETSSMSPIPLPTTKPIPATSKAFGSAPSKTPR